MADIQHSGVVVWRYEPPPRRITALGGRSALQRRPARVRIRLDSGLVLPFQEPDGRLAVGDRVVVTGPADLETEGGTISLRRAD